VIKSQGGGVSLVVGDDLNIDQIKILLGDYGDCGYYNDDYDYDDDDNNDDDYDDDDNDDNGNDDDYDDDDNDDNGNDDDENDNDVKNDDDDDDANDDDDKHISTSNLSTQLHKILQQINQHGKNKLNLLSLASSRQFLQY
jgi:hypothetical protein